jgi:hypothetical protein
MSETVVKRRYVATAPEPVAWDALVSLFEAVWGDGVSALPAYPDVLGGVSASWLDANDIEHRVRTLDELGEAYARGRTKRLDIGGYIDDSPTLYVRYTPASRARPWSRERARADATVSASDVATADRILGHVEVLFPNVERTLFVSYGGRQDEQLAERLVAVLAPRVPSHVDVFRAPRGLETGAEPNSSLASALASSSALVAVCSPRSRKSPWVAWEAATVRALGGRLIPLLVETSARDFGGPIMTFAEARKAWVEDELDEGLRDAVLAAGGTWEPLTADERESLAGVMIRPSA